MARWVRWATVRRLWIRTGVIGTVIFITWSLLAYRAPGIAREALASDPRVTVSHANHAWSFTPPNPAPAGLIFFPGALVDPVAYAPLVHAIAGAGYTSLLIEVPWRGAFGGAEGPEVFERARAGAAGTGIRRWVVAGHSRGGVIASYLVRIGFPGLAGAVLLGTSHPRDFSLAETRIPMTRVFGTRDTVADVEKLDRTRANLPPSTRIVRIDGGNHSQFGYYGFQPGDWPATISRDAQQAIVKGAILDALAAAAAPQQKLNDEQISAAGVYAVLMAMRYHGTPGATMVVTDVAISMPTLAGSSAARLEEFKPLPAALRQAASLPSPTTKGRRLDAALFPQGTRMVSKSALQAVFSGGSDYDLAPVTGQLGARGRLAFSEVLFTDDRLDALVYYEGVCGSLCAEGGYLWLHRESAQSAWTVGKNIVTWMA